MISSHPAIGVPTSSPLHGSWPSSCFTLLGFGDPLSLHGAFNVACDILVFRPLNCLSIECDVWFKKSCPFGWILVLLFDTRRGVFTFGRCSLDVWNRATCSLSAELKG